MGNLKESNRNGYDGVTPLGPGRWNVRGSWTDPKTGKRRQLERRIEAATARAASLKLEEFLTAARAGAEDRPSRKRVSECAESWLASRRASLDPRTAKTHGGAVTHIITRLGDYFVDALDRDVVQDMVNEALDEERDDGSPKYSPETIRGWLRRLSTMMLDEGLPDPTRRVVLPDAPDRGANRLSAGELAAVLSAYRKVDPDTFALIAVLAFTGLRWTHASALRWDDVEWSDGLILVRRKNVEGVTAPVSRKKKAPPEIPMPAELAAILNEHLAWAELSGFRSEWCFPARRTGRLMKLASNLRKRWAAALEAAGVADRVTIHGLRRTFGDLARRAGADAVVRRSLTAHAGEAMQAHYEGVGRDEQRAAMEGVVAQVKGAPKLVVLKGGCADPRAESAETKKAG